MNVKKAAAAILAAVMAVSLAAGCGSKTSSQNSNYALYEHTVANTPVPGENTDPSGESDPSGTVTPEGEITPGGETTPAETTPAPTPASYDITIRLAGDINLDENWATTKHMDECAGGIKDCVDIELMRLMQDADIFYLNNEFTYGTDTEKLAKKMYNFRANPDRVKVLTELGVDAVSLANNHVYDYQAKGLTETMKTLENEGIPYFGAGNTLEEAKKPLILEVQGRKIAFLSVMSDECDSVTKQATDTEPGIVRCSPGSGYADIIRETKKQADYVIVCVHWGDEYTYDLLDSQKAEAKEFAEAGADLIVGAHSHVVQTIDFIDDTLVCYSLGNYWFNEKKLFTTLFEVHLWGEGEEKNLEFKLYPALQKNCETRLLTTTDQKKEFFDLVRYISRSGQAKISDDGSIVKKS